MARMLSEFPLGLRCRGCSRLTPMARIASLNSSQRFIEFFTANIRNPNTRRAYALAAVQFAVWCEENDQCELADIEALHKTNDAVRRLSHDRPLRHRRDDEVSLDEIERIVI